MGLFGSGEAMRLAQRADDKANAANAVIAAGLAKLEQHIQSCDIRGRQLQDDLQRDRLTLHEWRKGLGERLDAQDKMMWGVARLVIAVLCSVIVTAGGFLIPHIVTFHS